jgi:hypothetical protein
MPIVVECGSCHQRFRAKDTLAGKAVKCPRCGGAIQVPMSASETPEEDAGDVYGVAAEAPQVPGPAAGGTVRHCPSCHQAMPPDAVICVGCGLDLRTGRKLEARRTPARAARSDEKDLSEPLLSPSEGWLGTAMRVVVVALLMGIATGGSGVLGVVVGMYAGVGGSCMAAGVAMAFSAASFFCFLRLMLEAFFESILCGVMFLFLPVYWLYFIVTRWEEAEVEAWFVYLIFTTALAWFFAGMTVDVTSL